MRAVVKDRPAARLEVAGLTLLERNIVLARRGGASEVVVVAADPMPQFRRLGALEVVGWNLVQSAGRKMQLRLYLRAHRDGPLRGHCTFIHVDHSPTRFSTEHFDTPYPTSLWREGDVLVDEFSFTLPAHFTRGTYDLAWGAGVLPCSDERRMPVTSGPHDAHHRVIVGKLDVR